MGSIGGVLNVQPSLVKFPPAAAQQIKMTLDFGRNSVPAPGQVLRLLLVSD